MPRLELDDYPEIMDTALVAELLRLNVDYIRRLARDGQIPSHRLPNGRAIRYFKAEIVQWLQGGT